MGENDVFKYKNRKITMKFEQRLEEKIGHDAGFRVPDGYFEAAFMRIEASLPERKKVEVARLTAWQRLKPYIYMAAMFAGIWLTMKMFYDVSQADRISLDNPPRELAMVAADTNSAHYYELSTGSAGSEESDYQLEYEVAGMYDSASELHNALQSSLYASASPVH